MAGSDDTRLIEVEVNTASGAGQARPAAAARATERPGTAATPAAPESWEEVDPEVWGLTFSAERNSVYHHTREAFYDGCHAWIMFGVIVASGATVVAALGDAGRAWVALVPAVLGALDLAFRFGEKARRHGFLARRSIEILGDLAGGQDAKHVRARLCAVYAEEPAERRALNALAYNQVARQVGRPEYQLKVSWVQRRLRHLVRFEGAKFALKGS